MFENDDFLQSLLGNINKNSILDLKGNLENIKAFPIFVSKKFEKFDLMCRHFFKKIEKNNFSLTFLPDLPTSNDSGKLILELSQTKPFLAF